MTGLSSVDIDALARKAGSLHRNDTFEEVSGLRLLCQATPLLVPAQPDMRVIALSYLYGPATKDGWAAIIVREPGIGPSLPKLLKLYFPKGELCENVVPSY